MIVIDLLACYLGKQTAQGLYCLIVAIEIKIDQQVNVKLRYPIVLRDRFEIKK